MLEGAKEAPFMIAMVRENVVVSPVIRDGKKWRFVSIRPVSLKTGDRLEIIENLGDDSVVLKTVAGNVVAAKARLSMPVLVH